MGRIILSISLSFIMCGIFFADFTLVNEFDSGDTELIAWGDYDNDNDQDVAVGNFGQNYLYTNDGSGNFTGSSQFGDDDTHSLVWADYDNDGDLDLAVGNTDGQNYLYKNNGGSFTEEPQFGTGTTLTLAWGDSDNDGDLDLTVGNQGTNYLYLNDGDGTFTEVSEFGAMTTRSLSWGDCDGDGDLDMAVANLNQQNYLYINTGNNNFTQTDEFGAGATTSIAWADYDNDGDLDVAVGNYNQQNKLYINDGGGNFISRDEFGVYYTHAVSWGDFDNDGDLDLAVGNTQQQNYLYTNDGDDTFSGQEQFGEGWTTTIAWGDCDCDGDLDLGVGNYGGEQNYLCQNTENDDDYLHIKLVGHFHDMGNGYSNRDGVGAKVFVFEDGHIRDPDYLLGFQEIEASAGYCGQNSSVVEFGLPSFDYVDVFIIWSGSGGYHIEQEVMHISVPQYLVIDEDGELIANAIVLTNFCAESCEDTLLLNWSVETTEGEVIEGFHLYRREMGLTHNINNQPVSEDTYPRIDTNTDNNWTKVNSHPITGQNPYTYIDDTVETSITYEYKLEAIVEDVPEILGTTTGTCSLPTSFSITSIHPNPSTDIASITLTTPQPTDVRIEVYDITGRLLYEGNQEICKGESVIDINTGVLTDGVYILQAVSGDVEETKKFVVVK